ncbi:MULTISPECIES: DUF4870 domain-containing protein [Lysobacter]|nr:MULTISPECIES: DUF4870 domain-containing protein [Lysobacter]
MSQNENEPAGSPPPEQEPQAQVSHEPASQATQGNGLSAEQRQWAMFAHLSALLGLFTGGVGCVIGPLVIWLIKKETMPFVDDQGKEALNFNITVAASALILTVVGTILLVILVGFLFYFAVFLLGIYWLVMTVIAAIKANEGVAYRYPFTLRLIK